jgi:hypothetical protein
VWRLAVRAAGDAGLMYDTPPTRPEPGRFV